MISSTLIPRHYMQIKANMMAEVEKYAKTVCLTVESWTSIKNYSYLAVTAHFFKEEDDKLVLKSVLLHCEPFDEQDTSAAVLASSLTQITEDWGIADKISFAVSENATNIVEAFKLKGWPFYECYALNFNLIVPNSLRPVESIVSKVSRIVTHFKMSDTAREALFRYQSDIQNISQPLNVKKCVVTRWSSIVYMLERFSQLREALQASYDFIPELPVVTTEEWEIIKQLSTVLKPFEEVATKMCDEKYLTASMAIMLTNSLKHICEQLKHEGFSEVVLQVLQHLQDGLEKYYGNIEQEPALALCMYLDPRFKEHFIKDPLIVRQTRLNIIEQINKEISASLPIPSTPNLSIWAELISNSKSETISAEQELDLFNKEPMLNRISCPLEWWQSRGNIYPNLYKMFKENCHVVVTSISCERMFSKAGCVLSDRRSRISTKRTSELIFLNANDRTE